MRALKSLLPVRLKAYISSTKFVKFLRLLRCYLYDMNRFSKYSGLQNPYNRKATLQAKIIKSSHCIEKAFSLKQTRIGFGAKRIDELINDLNVYTKHYGTDKWAQTALNILVYYEDFNSRNGLEDLILRKKLEALKKTIPSDNKHLKEGGIIELTKRNILDSCSINFEDFVNCRHSIRNFGEGDVDDELIKDAIRIALKTPSVCNRQGWKVHLYNTKDFKTKILAEQTGNRGFGDFCSKILIVTCDLSAFLTIGERNQGFIDGGLFAMSLVYALHSKGIGTCCLNLSVEPIADKNIRKITGMSENESGILMIAIGNLSEGFEVAYSKRKDLSEVLVVHS